MVFTDLNNIPKHGFGVSTCAQHGILGHVNHPKICIVMYRTDVNGSFCHFKVHIIVFIIVKYHIRGLSVH
jgi:hypothetical protein